MKPSPLTILGNLVIFQGLLGNLGNIYKILIFRVI